MPVIDTPPPQLVRAATENDDRLETGMRDTEYITAVEIDHEAKAKYEEQRRQAAAGRAETSELAEPPPPSSPAQAGTHGEAPADDTDAIETSARERMDSVGDEVAPPPAQAPTQRPSQPGASPASRASEPADSAAPRPSRPAPSPALRASQPVIPNIPPIAPTPIVPAASPTAALANASGTVNYSTAPASLPPPKTATLPATGPTPACPQCESPMAWVEEHLRFYCKSCRMYF